METKILKNLLLKASNVNATDIHIKSNCNIFFRINNELVKQDIIYNDSDIICIIKEINSKIDSYKYEQDFSGHIIIDNHNYNLRCNFYKTTSLNSDDDYNLAIRILNNTPKTLEELGLPKRLEKLIDVDYGLILISGATGNGKTTTLASLIELINNKYKRHIIIIEDPIKYYFRSNNSLINQREIGPNTKDFPSALRAALRQDPDVIIIGELRDAETIRTALWAAETGHLVLATIHAGNAIETIDKLVQYFPKEQDIIRYSLANSLQGIISQKIYQSSSYKKKICLCDLLINNLLIKKFIRENNLQSIKNEMENNRDMILRDKSEKEYRNLGII
ncbi:type IV pilus twitching motility protein PilT [Megamonas funiformis]|uniref:type IV pilus twitching motility protein PilT n=1 Tax=Megamonas funiformis TaxID=437897 RepID=UPI003F984372